MPTISAIGDGLQTRFSTPPGSQKSVSINGNPVLITGQDSVSVTLAVAPPAGTSFSITFVADSISDVDLAAEDTTYNLQTADGTWVVWGTWFGGVVARCSALASNIGSTLIGHGAVSVSTALTNLATGLFTPAAVATPAVNGTVVFELTSNTSLTIRAKGSDAVVRSVVLTLA